ncbi:MAG: hypothetical protein M3499_07000 [Actinomycetota bacterium]|nr:hypothetical protein [Actinomycetota bacterium]
MLPYASYLRVYEPLAALSPGAQAALRRDGEAAADVPATLVIEQATVLQRTMRASGPHLDVDQAGTYVIRVSGRSFYCPADMPLRSWLSLTSLLESLGGSNVALLFPAESLAVADETFLSWRRAHPEAVPHVRQVTWGIPRTWFTLVAPEERDPYDAGGFESLRYRAKVLDARRRVMSALDVLEKVLDEADLLEEMQDLAGWLHAFDPAGWLELDYAGIARCFTAGLDDDHSALDIHRALRALRRGDWTTAGAAYRAFEARWRVINAYERVN